MDHFKKPVKQGVHFNPANREATINARKEADKLITKDLKDKLSGLKKNGRAK